MPFFSIEFIFIFLPITWIIYFFCNQRLHLTRLATITLCLASLFFYAYAGIQNLPVLIGSIIINYLIGYALQQPSNLKIITHKVLLWIGIIFNVCLLGYYKYTGFIIDNLNQLTHNNWNVPQITLPLAISFFTFQQIAYLVSSYRQDLKTTEVPKTFLDYVCFVSFFPYLVSGPIVTSRQILPQLKNKRNKLINWNNIAQGCILIILGLGKKLLVADYFAEAANNGFNNWQTLHLTTAWISSISYTLQLYFDFSGYCDMASGIALLFNIKLPINFNSPYKALNIQDFWRRWHITLSNWLKDYLYIPLGGNRHGNLRTYINVFIVFLIGGIWHGAGWTFIVWGTIHGTAQMLYRFYKQYLERWLPISTPVAWFLTFNVVNVSWVYFRSQSIQQANAIIDTMYNFHNQTTEALLVLGVLACIGLKHSQEINWRKNKTLAIIMAFLLFYCIVQMISNYSPDNFIYANF